MSESFVIVFIADFALQFSSVIDDRPVLSFVVVALICGAFEGRLVETLAARAVAALRGRCAGRDCCIVGGLSDAVF